MTNGHTGLVNVLLYYVEHVCYPSPSNSTSLVWRKGENWLHNKKSCSQITWWWTIGFPQFREYKCISVVSNLKKLNPRRRYPLQSVIRESNTMRPRTTWSGPLLQMGWLHFDTPEQVGNSLLPPIAVAQKVIPRFPNLDGGCNIALDLLSIGPISSIVCGYSGNVGGSLIWLRVACFYRLDVYDALDVFVIYSETPWRHPVQEFLTGNLQLFQKSIIAMALHTI